MELRTEPVQPPGTLDDAQKDAGPGVLSPLFQDIVVRDSGILEKVLQDVLLLDENFHLMPVRFECSDGVLVVVEVSRVAEIDKDYHFINLL